MTPEQVATLQPGDTVRMHADPDARAIVLDQFRNQLILLWTDGEIRHHTNHSFPHLYKTTETPHDPH